MADSTEIRIPLETIVQAAIDLLRSQGLRPEPALLMVMGLLLHRLRHRANPTTISARIWNGLHQDPPLSLLDHILHEVEIELPIRVNRPQTPTHVAARLLDMIDRSVASIPPGAATSLRVEELEVATYFSEAAPTPRSIVSMMVAAIDPRPGSTLLDPACGSGGFLLASLEHVTRMNINGSLQVSGIERLTSLAELARINLAMHGHRKGRVLDGDAFEMTDTVSPRLFDYVLSNPPAAQPSEGPRHLDHSVFRFGPPQTTTDFNFIQLAVAHLKPSGSAALLVRHRPLMGGGKDQEIRRRLLQAGCITAVISLPARLLPTTSAACAILLLRAPTQRPVETTVKLIAADSEFGIDERGKRVLTADNIKRIRGALVSESIEGFSVVKTLNELAQVGYDLNPASHFGTGRTPVNLGPHLVMKRMDAIASVFRGKELGARPAGHTPILQGRDLPMRKIYVEDLKRSDVSTVKNVLRAAHGDILVQRIGESPCSYHVEPDLADVPVSGTAYLIRLHQPDELTARFIVQFLNSSTGRERLKPSMRGSGAPTLRKSQLNATEVPFVEESIMRLAIELHDFESLLHEHVALAGDLKSRLFSVSRPEDFSETFRDIQLRYRVMKESLPGSGNLAALNATIGAAALEEALSVWEQHQATDDEAFWHRVLDERPFLFAQLFHYPVVIVQDHAYVGGKRLDNRGGALVDFLAKNTTTNAALIIEIKTPCTSLLGSEYRQNIYPSSRELSGALSQVLHYQSSLASDIHQLRRGVDEHLESDMPRCVVIAGNVGKELDTASKKRAFERWRKSLHGVEVVGFDEVFGRARDIFEILTKRNTSP